MTKQDTVAKAQKSLERTIKLFGDLELESCDAAAGCEKSAEANAKFTEARGLLIQAKGVATVGCNVAPEITPMFGGK